MNIKISLLKPSWPIWKAVENMVGTRTLQGTARTIEGVSVHVVLVPPEHTEKFVALVNDFHDEIRKKDSEQ